MKNQVFKTHMVFSIPETHTKNCTKQTHMVFKMQTHIKILFSDTHMKKWNYKTHMEKELTKDVIHKIREAGLFVEPHASQASFEFIDDNGNRE